MTINTHNRALETRVLHGEAHRIPWNGENRFLLTQDQLDRLLDAARAEGPVQGETEHLLSTEANADRLKQSIGEFVTPPADEVGRAVALATGLACRLDRTAPGSLPQDAQLYREEAIALSLILSHVSRLEGENVRLDNVASHWVREVHETTAALKLAVEALEKIKRCSVVVRDHGNPWNGGPNPILLAREALRSISSLRPSVSTPGGDA